MTLDAATIEFLEKLNADPALQAQLEARIPSTDDRIAAIVEVAAANGHEVNRTGITAALAALRRAMDDDEALDESQLEAIAGGFNPQPEPPARISKLGRAISIPTQTLMWG